MHGGETASPVRTLKAPRWKLHSTMSSSMKLSDKEPDPCVQASSVTKMDPLRLKTASTNSPTSTLIAAPTGTSEARQTKRRSAWMRVSPSSSIGAAVKQIPASQFHCLRPPRFAWNALARYYDERCHIHVIGTIMKY